MSLQHSPKIVTDGLVLALDAGNSKSYISGSITWADLSGNNNSGSLVNGPTFSGANNGSIVFDGSNDYIDIVSGSSVQLTEAMSIQTWVRLTTNTAETIIATRSIITGSTNPTDWRFMTTVYGGSFGTNWGFRNTPNGTDLTEFTGSIRLSTGSWHNLTVTYNRSKLNLYYNGVLDQSYDHSPALTTVYPIRLGQGIGGERRYLNGTIANFQMYNRALLPNEVLQNFNAARGRFGV